MEEYNLQEIRIEDYNSIKEYYQMRRPETADSNIDVYKRQALMQRFIHMNHGQLKIQFLEKTVSFHILHIIT